MRTLDIHAWPRKDQFHFFRQMDYPHFNLCANLDLTLTLRWMKTNGISFFKAMVYLAMTAANDLPEFRYRLRGDTVVEHDCVHPSFTIMRNDGVFTFCPVTYTPDFAAFYTEAGKQTESRKTGSALVDEDGDDRIYITSIPWVSFTSVVHPIQMNPVDSIPRLTWGKYEEAQGRIRLPFSVQVHHALMDGQHAGMYFQRIQELLDYPEQYLRL